MTALTTEQIDEKLQQHALWRLDGERLAIDLQFSDFNDAWRFMNHVAVCAEAQDHHPNWYNVYGTVQIRLSTHDAKGITERDFRLVESIDQYLQSHPYQVLPPTPFS